MREDTCTNSWSKSSFNSRIHSLPSATFLSAEKLLSAASRKDCSMILGSLKAGSPFCKEKLSKTSTSKTCKAILLLKEKPCDGYDRSRSTMGSRNPTRGDKDVSSTSNRNDPQTPTIVGVEAWGTDEVLLSKDMVSNI